MESKEVKTMTEQQKITALYEKLPPEKKAVFMMMVRMIGNMMTTLVTMSGDKS
jgi:hypothetical protein